MGMPYGVLNSEGANQVKNLGPFHLAYYPVGLCVLASLIDWHSTGFIYD